MTRNARAIADLADGTILATVDIAVPPERVFRALTSADEVPLWWGDDAVYRTKTWTSDLRVGGKWRAEGVGSDGKPFSVEGEFLELDPPHKIVQTWNPDWDRGETTTLTYRIAPVEGGSRLTVRHTGFAGRAETCARHGQGWELVLGWIDRYLRKEDPPKYFFCRLVPPRPSFALDMNADERAIMQAHVGYWMEKLTAGHAIVFGPVGDPKGPWGLGVMRVANEAAARDFEQNDPAIKSGHGFHYEIFPMLQAVHR